jgi:hypothetical protein
MSPETRRVEFTVPQYHQLARVARTQGVLLESHRPELDIWDARSLYEVAVALPWKKTREFKMRESILAKLEWAKPEPKAKSLAEVLACKP